jgi:hypothetical protein
MPPQWASVHDHHMESYISGAKERSVVGKIRNVMAMKKDNTEIPVEISLRYNNNCDWNQEFFQSNERKW